MRLPLAINLKARTGTPDKDARVKNGIVEVKGESSLVRLRPGISESEATGLGLFAQGGMQFGRVLYSMNGDIGYYFRDGVFVGGYNFTLGTPLMMYANGGSYSIGDEVYADDPETGDVSPWYPVIDNPPVPPSSGSYYWSKTQPGASRYLGSHVAYGAAVVAATVESAALAAYQLEPAKTCATKYAPTQNWRVYAGVSFNAPQNRWDWYANTFTDTDPYNCSTSPLDSGAAVFGYVYQTV